MQVFAPLVPAAANTPAKPLDLAVANVYRALPQREAERFARFIERVAGDGESVTGAA